MSFLKFFLNHRYIENSSSFWNFAVLIFKARPQIRFNKDGTLLAVIAAGYMIKVLGLGSGDVPNMPQPRQEVCSNSSCEVISEALKKVGNLVLSAIC